MHTLLRLLLVAMSLHVCLAAWADNTKPVVNADGTLNLANAHLAAWLNPEALVNMGDSQLLDGDSNAWTPAKGALLASGSHVNGPMVKRNQANGFPIVRFNTPSSDGAAIKFQAVSAPASATVFVVARLDLASTSAAATYQHLWKIGSKGFAVAKNGEALVGKVDSTPPAVVADNSEKSTGPGGAGTINSGSWHIYALDALPAAHTAYVDGTANAPLANTATPFATIAHADAAFADGAFELGGGAVSVANGALQGDIAEVRFCNTFCFM
jgi:hypothetical protein